MESVVWRAVWRVECGERSVESEVWRKESGWSAEWSVENGQWSVE